MNTPIRRFVPTFCVRFTLALCLFIGAPRTSPANAPQPQPRYQRALVIGDSLTVGPFGDKLEEFLLQSLGESNVYLYAVCGSSPEHWLEAEPEFRSRCGYRLKIPRKKTELGRHENGHPPEPRATRKLEDLLPKIRPDAVIVQLGTNWFDRLAESPGEATRNRIDHILDQFQAVIRKKAPGARLIWITPPDSSRFRNVQATVTTAIREAGARHRFWVINSSKMLSYTPGKTGGDGVHLASPAADQWFEKVRPYLHRCLPR